MAEEYDTPDPEFVKGFNEGYTLAQHQPDLAEQLSKAVGESVRGTAFQAGRQQLLLELERDREANWLRRDSLSPEPSAPDKEPDRDLEWER